MGLILKPYGVPQKWFHSTYKTSFVICLRISCAVVLPVGWRLSTCQRHYQEASRFYSTGHFTPKCHADGRYEEVQCYGSRCFCVGSDGLDSGVNETVLPQTPSCPPSRG